MKKKTILIGMLLIALTLAGCTKKSETSIPTSKETLPLETMKDNRIRVGSFNLASMRYPDFEAQNKLMVSSKVDVVGVQEIDKYTKRQNLDMLKEVANEDYPEYEFAKAVNWKDQGEYGIGVISKYIITDYTDGIYDMTGEEDRAYQNIKINTNNKQKLSIYNTHLAFESVEIRERQINQLLKKISEDNSMYKIITGDFNMDQTHEEWQIFTKKGFKIANGKDDNWFDTFTWRDDTMKIFAVDNIIVSDNIEIKRVDMTVTPVSDHNLLYADLVLN